MLILNYEERSSKYHYTFSSNAPKPNFKRKLDEDEIPQYVEKFVKLYENGELNSKIKIIASWIKNSKVYFNEELYTHGQEIETNRLWKYDDNINYNFERLILETEHYEGSDIFEYNLPAYNVNNLLPQLLFRNIFYTEDYINDYCCIGSHYHVRFYHPLLSYDQTFSYRRILITAGYYLATRMGKLLTFMNTNEFAEYYDGMLEDYDKCRFKWSNPMSADDDKYSAFYINWLSDEIFTIENRLCENNTLSCYYFAQLWHRYAHVLSMQYTNETPKILEKQIKNDEAILDEELLRILKIPELQLPLTPITIRLEYYDDYPGETYLEELLGDELENKFIETYTRMIDKLIGLLGKQYYKLFIKDPHNLPIINL